MASTSTLVLVLLVRLGLVKGLVKPRLPVQITRYLSVNHPPGHPLADVVMHDDACGRPGDRIERGLPVEY